MRTAVISVVLSTLIIAGLMISFSACSNKSSTSVLPGVEIGEYQGQDLSSINDFRENSIKGPQYIDLESYRLEITGLVENPGSFSYNEIINNHKLYNKVVTLNCVEGWSATILWEGVLVKDLIEEAGASSNANTVIFHAYDGYTTSLSVDYLVNQNIIMAYKMNGLALLPERGAPFQLVAESKWGYKWIKWITKIELSDNADYEGYWESRGFSNVGDLDKGFFD